MDIGNMAVLAFDLATLAGWRRSAMAHSARVIQVFCAAGKRRGAQYQG